MRTLHRMRRYQPRIIEERLRGRAQDQARLPATTPGQGSSATAGRARNEPRVSSAKELEAPDGRPPSPCAPSCSSLVARRTYAVRWVPAQTSASRALPFSGCGLTGGLPIASRTPSGGPCERARRAFASISARRKGSKRWRRGADNVRRSENDGVLGAPV